MAKLSALAVANAKKPGYLSDGLGLYLAVGKTGKASWIFRWKRDGKSHDMGLGTSHTISLASARAKAAIVREQIHNGIDPFAARRETRFGRLLPLSREVADPKLRPLSIATILALPRQRVEVGVYFLFFEGALQYIGQTKDLINRIAKHRRQGKIAFDEWRFIPILDQDLDYIEALYIQEHQPPCNRQLNITHLRRHFGQSAPSVP